MKPHTSYRPLVFSGLLLGIGMGGFIDGILFHQILQVHNMLSNRYFPDTLLNVEINMFWDGIFHAVTWLTTVAGIWSLWNNGGLRHRSGSSRVLLGSAIAGWGLFNFVEGVIDHQILQVHHVVERAPETLKIYYDLGFLAFGVLLILGGSYMIWTQTKVTQGA